jgi:hypothetical protein
MPLGKAHPPRNVASMVRRGLRWSSYRNQLDALALEKVRVRVAV